MNERMPFGQPDYRTTLSRDRLSLIPWSPWMLGSAGPANRLLCQGRTALLADLTVVRDDDLRPREVIISELAKDSGLRLRSAIVDWASLLGYERVWFSDDVIKLDPAAAVAGELVGTTCATCASEWSDGSPEFWISAQRSGVFPLFCPICGHPVPQWSVLSSSQAWADCRLAPEAPQTESPTAAGTELRGL
jgi:hypothetical protein